MKTIKIVVFTVLILVTERGWAQSELADNDKQLNDSYQKMLFCVEPAQQDSLREAQRKWLPYRNAQAKFDMKYFSNSSYKQAIEELNLERINEFDNYTKYCGAE